MEDRVVMRINNLSKAYRIGLSEQRHDTLGAVMGAWLKSPFQNFKRLRNLSRITGKTQEADIYWSLKDVSFEVKKGVVLGIIGKNGAGKSTLLKILSQITDPTVGEAEISGRVASLLEVGTGFNPELTGRENVFLNGTILGMTKAEIINKFTEIVEFSGVEKFIDTPVKRYSSGMKVRLAFAVAAHLDPEILIVDEVLAVGDSEFQKKCIQKMQNIADESGRTILFVSHDLIAVQKLCTEVILLEKGRVAMRGEPQKVVDYYLKGEAATAFENDFSNRRGTGPVRLESVNLLNKNGETAGTFQFQEPIAIQFALKAHTLLQGVTLTFAIRNIEGRELFYSSSKQSDTDVVIGDKEFIVLEAKLSPNYFVPGIYFIRVSLHWNGALSDRVEDVVSFEILDSAEDVRMLPDFRVGNIYYHLNWTVLP
jgi:lipopolysaccharide transport system ATP-binding protein